MCPMRQTVFIALLHTLTVLPFFDHERSQAPASTDPSTVTESGSLVGRFLQFRRQIVSKPAPALSFRSWPFSCGRGTTLQTRYAPRFARFPFPRLHAQARADRAFSSPSCTAGCEPQTLQTLFSGRTVAKCCARAPRIGISPGRTPFAWGMWACPDHNNRR